MIGYEIVGIAFAFAGFIATYSYQVFYKYIVENEKKVRKMVEEDVLEVFKNYKKILKEATAEAIVDDLTAITEFSHNVDDSKTYFERDILIGGIIVVVSSFAHVYHYGQQISNDAFTVGIIVALYILHRFYYGLAKNKRRIERFLDEEPIEDILKDDE